MQSEFSNQLDLCSIIYNTAKLQMWVLECSEVITLCFYVSLEAKKVLTLI